MKAVIYDKKNKSEKFIYQSVDKPECSADEVLIKISCVSPNAADYRSMKMNMIPKSKIFGSGISGIVESVGEQVNKIKVGDEVFADLADSGFGGFAEYAVAPLKAVSIKPKNITFAEAACLPVASTTAINAVRDAANVEQNQTVLIVGASGAVGTFALQLAKYYGAIVTAVTSERNAENALKNKADHIINYKTENFIKSGKMYDAIIAVNGGYSLLGYKKCLNPGGLCVVVGGSMGQILKSLFFGKLLSTGGRKILSLSSKTNASDLDRVGSLAAKGILKANIAHYNTLENTHLAMRYLMDGHAQGKVVIKV